MTFNHRIMRSSKHEESRSNSVSAMDWELSGNELPDKFCPQWLSGNVPGPKTGYGQHLVTHREVSGNCPFPGHLEPSLVTPGPSGNSEVS